MFSSVPTRVFNSAHNNDATVFDCAGVLFCALSKVWPIKTHDAVKEYLERQSTGYDEPRSRLTEHSELRLPPQV